jgi:predicted ATPase
MLKRLSVRGFKSLRDVEVGLSPIVVLLGPNAAGKSNFLEAILLLSRLVTERTLADAFKPPLRGYPHESFSFPLESGLPGLLLQEHASLVIEADVDPPNLYGEKRPRGLRYRVEVRIDPISGDLEVRDEYLAHLTQGGEPMGTPRIELAAGHLAVRRKGESGRPRHEKVGLNHTIASNLQYSGKDRYPELDRLRAEMSSWRSYYLDPRVAMRTPQAPKEATDPGPQGEEIAPFLHRLAKGTTGRKHFDAIRRALRSAIPSIQSLGVDLDPQRGTLDIQVVQEGTPFSSRVISEGTLRVLALCAISGNPWPSRLVAFEEPENGVQPRRIEVVADLLLSMARGGRQVIVTTHSPVLVSAMWARKVARKVEGHSQIELLRASGTSSGSYIEPVDLTPLFRDEEIAKDLSSPDDQQVISEVLLRGWLDG